MKGCLTTKTGNCSLTGVQERDRGTELTEGRNEHQQGEESGKVPCGVFPEQWGRAHRSAASVPCKKRQAPSKNGRPSVTQ